MQQRSICHLDVDAFFASVEQRDDPNLRGKPVAVGTGVVASCSYEARRYGVRTAMRLAEARRRCRPLIVVPGQYPKYEMASRQILAMCREVTPVVEVAALDDLYLDVSNDGLELDDPLVLKMATGIRERVLGEIQLSLSMGLGANKFVSRVATTEAKPGRIVQVPWGTEREYLAPWSADLIPGVGHKTAFRLGRLNVNKIGEVAEMPRPVLRSLLGQNNGKQIHDYSHGIDPRPVVASKQQQTISRSTSFDPPEADRDFLRAMLSYLLERACSWLRWQNLMTRAVAVQVRYGDYRSDGGRETFREATNDELDLQAAARERFEKVYTRRLPLRWLGIELGPLMEPNSQMELFVDPEDERRKRLLGAKDKIRKRFGFTSISSGETLLLDQKMDKDRENYVLRTPCLTR